MSIEIRPATSSDIDNRLYDLEIASFPSDEAASLEGMHMRQREASDFFYVGLQAGEGQIVGFINGTKTSATEIHHDSMSSHVPEGRTLVIHSVTVDPAHRRKGIATTMLKQYVSAMRARADVNLLLLLKWGKMKKKNMFYSITFFNEKFLFLKCFIH
jgi:guanine nucleotide exchange factor